MPDPEEMIQQLKQNPLNPLLHERVAIEAKMAGKSLNKIIEQRLASSQ